ncbi:MAG TPA: hypothetical protein PLI18_03310, partial [Pirellulaceae bacterium]|nr:hypothetical protein [Pirellulaceae bacterium]
YGFAGPVTITVSAPSIPGLSIAGGELAADATHLDLAVATTAETPVGPIELTITATSKFNELDVTGSTTASITIVSGN